MAHPVDRTGQRHGRLLVISQTDRRSASRNVYWLCRCDCGSEIEVDSGSLGRVTNSCGCMQREMASARLTTHGHSKSPDTQRALSAYYNARSRCLNPSNKRYARYGGRGVTMCDRWLNDAGAFIQDMGGCSPKMTLERISVDGNYEPSNCTWATIKAQARNRSTNHRIPHDGGTLTLREYAAVVGVNYDALKSRMRNNGLSAADATTLIKLHPRRPMRDTTVGRKRDEKGRLLPKNA